MHEMTHYLGDMSFGLALSAWARADGDHTNPKLFAPTSGVAYRAFRMVYPE